MSKVIIRKARKSDEAGIGRLLSLVCQEFGWDYHGDFRPHDSDPEFYSSMGGKMLVAVESHQVVGSIAFLKKGKTAMLVRFYVLQDRRRRGTGTRLYSELKAEMERKGVNVCFLGTEPENIPYLRLFLDCDDFVRVNQTPVRFPDEASSLYFIRKIQRPDVPPPVVPLP